MAATAVTRGEILSIFKSLMRTKQQVFRGDTKALSVARDRIREEFGKHKTVNDPVKINELMAIAKESEVILKTKVVQVQEVRPNIYDKDTRDCDKPVTESDNNSNDDGDGPNTTGWQHYSNENMIKLTPLQRAIITIGSGLSAFFDPTKAENIATFGEISAELVLDRLYKKMQEDSEGNRILSNKPRINSKTVDLDYLSTLPEGTLGWAYVQFLRKNNVTPDSRLPVRFIENPELAYVMQRYREVHDLVHTVTGQPTNMLGEVVVKWIEGIQTGLPMCVTGGLFGATRLRPKQRQNYINSHLKWAIDVGFTSRPFLFMFYEERWEQSLDELRYYICPKLLVPPETYAKK